MLSKGRQMASTASLALPKYSCFFVTFLSSAEMLSAALSSQGLTFSPSIGPVLPGAGMTDVF